MEPRVGQVVVPVDVARAVLEERAQVGKGGDTQHVRIVVAGVALGELTVEEGQVVEDEVCAELVRQVFHRSVGAELLDQQVQRVQHIVEPLGGRVGAGEDRFGLRQRPVVGELLCIELRQGAREVGGLDGPLQILVSPPLELAEDDFAVRQFDCAAANGLGRCRVGTQDAGSKTDIEQVVASVRDIDLPKGLLLCGR